MIAAITFIVIVILYYNYHELTAVICLMK